MYMNAVIWNTKLNEPVLSRMIPAVVTLKTPPNEPRVLLSPNNFPALWGAMSDMFATNPACPRALRPSASMNSGAATPSRLPKGLVIVSNAAAVPTNDVHWSIFLTLLTLVPFFTSQSARTPDIGLQTAMTAHGRREKMLDDAKFKENCLLKYVGNQLKYMK
mmetsp:Transcript_4463/g.11599  ORF Transcript_4463/g.11599 Transcript_4463/m.11599 type:complete len:162 (+) Transcript_4463:4054-4539(+)